MKRYIRTVVLALAAVSVLAWRLHRVKHPDPPRGLPVLLAHTCSWQESFRQIGDDRQIIVTDGSPGRLEINYMPFDEVGLRREFALIYETRAEKLAWFEGNREISYGEAVKTVGDMYESGFHADIVLTSLRDEALYTAKPASIGPCPYKN
jgi:hypothetical protein